MDDWNCIANRGEFSWTVATRARAEQDNIPLHADAVLVGVLHREDSPDFYMGFKSIVSLQDFLIEMEPTSVAVLSSADSALLLAAVERAAGCTLH